MLKKFRFELAAIVFFISVPTARIILGNRSILMHPDFWIINFLSWAVALCLLVIGARRELVRTAWITAMSCFLALALGEAFFSFKNPRPSAKIYYLNAEEIKAVKSDPSIEHFKSNYNVNHPFLGFAHKEKAARNAGIKMCGDEVIYDVIYTIMKNGWRVVPQNKDAEIAVVFFGCSFIFGEGLDDRDSLPYIVAEKLGSGYQVFNFGFSGYGSHHMLAQIQHGFLDDICKKYKKTLVFHSMIMGHELRSGGVTGWDRNGPAYALKDGKLVYEGSFADRHGFWGRKMFDIFQNSLIYQEMSKILAGTKYMKQVDLAIIAEGGRIVAEQYHSPFTVMLWPGAEHKDALAKQGLPCLDLGELVPELVRNPDKYRLHKFDIHPTAEAMHMVAEPVVRYIRKQINNMGQAVQ